MIDHLSFGVAHVGRSRAFYDSTLGALGYKRLHTDDESIGTAQPSHSCGCNMHLAPSPLIPTRGCTCRSRPLRPSKSTRSTVPHSSTAEDNGGPASANTTARATTQRSSSIPTGIGWKRIANSTTSCNRARVTEDKGDFAQCGIRPAIELPVAVVRRNRRARGYRASRVRCSCSPSPSTPRRTVWPAFRNTGDGLMPMPTPGGVPVVITSPGCSVMQLDR